MIVIGSKALLGALNKTDDERWDKSDFDVLMTPTEFKQWASKYKPNISKLYPKGENKYKAILVDNFGASKQYEIEIGYEGTSAKWLLDRERHVTSYLVAGFFGEIFYTLTLEFQLLTKRSHLIYPVHFEKNIEDYHLIIKSLIGKSLFYNDFKSLFKYESYKEYYDIRYAEAKERYKKFKTPNLHVTNEDFFSSKLAVPTYFIHDHIHEVMKHYDKPVYEMMKRDFSLAKCEQDMFFSLSNEERVRCVQEEAYVIALERYIIPQSHDFSNDHFECYKRAVQRICTTLCSGWFRDFAIESYPTVIDWYDKGFVDKFYKAFLNSEIKTKNNKIKQQDVPLFLQYTC